MDGYHTVDETSTQINGGFFIGINECIPTVMDQYHTVDGASTQGEMGASIL